MRGVPGSTRDERAANTEVARLVALAVEVPDLAEVSTRLKALQRERGVLETPRTALLAAQESRARGSTAHQRSAVVA